MIQPAKLALADCHAVLFDFDGVILDTEWPIYQTWHDLFQREGHPLPPEIYVKCIGSDFDTWSPEKYLEQLTGKDFDWESENAARQIDIVRAVNTLTPMPGVAELIELTKDKANAVVSSSSHDWVDGWLAKVELEQHFDITVCRGDAKRIKPAPDLYLEAARQLDVNPENCLVIEDSLNGMLSALGAGMQVIAVPNQLTNMLDFSAADWKIDSLAELL